MIVQMVCGPWHNRHIDLGDRLSFPGGQVRIGDDTYVFRWIHGLETNLILVHDMGSNDE